MRHYLGVVGGSLCLLTSTAACAQAADPATAQTYSLTPEQKMRVLDAGTEQSAEAARLARGNGTDDRQIHGEVGAMVGTGGTRGAYGTAAIPLGDNAGAVISFEHSRFGDRRR